MRRHRQRRRDGLRCLIIELRETEIDALISNGLLAAEDRQDYDSLQSAFYSFMMMLSKNCVMRNSTAEITLLGARSRSAE